MEQNRLANETSPYLLQHAENPVDWYPWSPEAFEKARKEDKPIFLSIGYSTCHWCHVMAHESFEDSEVARKMNRTFVSIKVDREERPDIDSVYMKAAALATGRGGWPLTVIMTPDRKPFFLATYIPKNSRYGMTGLLDLIDTVSGMWKDHRDELLSSAESIVDALNQRQARGEEKEIDEGMVERAFLHFQGSFDRDNGGFGRAPKFPSPHQLIFLIRHWWRTGNMASLEMATTTLRKMRMGGIYDHVGGGFHRYSTDPEWILPHFEKMLYDQALHTLAYTEAFLATGDPVFKETAISTLDYVLRDLRSPEGGFYSSEDADSEGVEGKFYTWKPEEIHNVLGTEAGDKLIEAYKVKKDGNFHDESTGKKSGTNVLHLKGPVKEGVFEPMLEKLRLEREKRVRPSRDEKILTDWNSLMISALSRAYQAFGDPGHLDAAVKAAEMIWTALRDNNGRLLHSYKDGGAAIRGFLEDHSYLLNGLLDLYESTFDITYLERAVETANMMIDLFGDKEGGFYQSPRDGEDLLVREKEAYDGAAPSGNSMASYGLLRLARMTGQTSYEKLSSLCGKSFIRDIEGAPWGFTHMLSSYMHGEGPAREIVIAGKKNDPATIQMIEVVRSTYLPNKVVLLKEPGPAGDRLSVIAPFTKESEPIGGKNTGYVCQGWNCDVPTTDINRFSESLKRLER